MKPEAPDAFFFGAVVDFEKLLTRHAEFSFFCIPDNSVAGAQRNRGIAEANDVGQPGGFLEEIEMIGVIEVDERASFFRLNELLCRRVVGAEYDLPSAYTNTVGEDKLRKRTAVQTAPFLFHDLEDLRIRQCFDGEVLFEPFVPRERIAEPVGLTTDTSLVIYIEGRRMCADKFLYLIFCEWKCFHTRIFSLMERTARSIFSLCP